jgi:hypothetical protein
VTGGAERPEKGGEPGRPADREAVERRRRRARVFGEVLPDRTSDERGDAWGEKESSSDEWLRGQVPPHHG